MKETQEKTHHKIANSLFFLFPLLEWQTYVQIRFFSVIMAFYDFFFVASKLFCFFSSVLTAFYCFFSTLLTAKLYWNVDVKFWKKRKKHVWLSSVSSTDTSRQTPVVWGAAPASISTPGTTWNLLWVTSISVLGHAALSHVHTATSAPRH